MKSGDRLILDMRARAYFLKLGLPELDPSETELVLWLWFERN